MQQHSLHASLPWPPPPRPPPSLCTLSFTVSSKKSPLVPPPCCHGDIDIKIASITGTPTSVSFHLRIPDGRCIRVLVFAEIFDVGDLISMLDSTFVTCNQLRQLLILTELADGSLFFSFGVSEPHLSSSHTEDDSGRLTIRSRLPSRFRRRSPVPPATVEKKRWEEKNIPIREAADVTPPPSGGAVKLSSRPKSSFVKRSPIPRSVQSVQEVTGLRTSSILNHSENALPSKQQLSSKGNKRSPSSGTVSHTKEREHVEKEKIPGSLPSEVVAMESSKAMKQATVPPPLDHDSAAFSSIRPLKKHAGAQRPKPKSKRSATRHGDTPAAESISSSQDLSEKSLMQKAPSSLDVNIRTQLSGVTKANESSDGRKHNSMSSDPQHQSESKLDFVAHSDLGKCTLLELKSIAKSRGLKGYSRLKKGELLDFLRRKES